MACVYPDARSPQELWENVLAQRRAFRHLPDNRLSTADYLAADRQAADKTYIAEGAVIEGYEFDRVAFRVAGNTFRTADLAHWLALDVASRALLDAGYPAGEGLPRDATGCILGNTLTGEFSRSGLMRLRWPYVRRVVESALVEQGWSADRRGEFMGALETEYKAPFPPVGEESLAGGLSNTIAGRICNHFDLHGGGYTVDGACASSLLAVANACSALAAGDLDVALAGGVDLSLDPFEIVGFAKTGALAPEMMRIYDRQSAGFWPGEGCGFVVLMRHEDAVAAGRRIYATIQGWGISSDGSGGITRPEVEGQLRALRSAYRRAGYGIESVNYFEGHGTGTSVGDSTELRALSRARREANGSAPAAVIGSIKANIGHTKAAAGVAGLIKATQAVHTQTLPPITGCLHPAEELVAGIPALRILREAEAWPADLPLRAGVSAMGFGGINAHITLEGVSSVRRHRLSARERLISHSTRDAELFLFSGEDRESLLAQIKGVGSYAARLSLSELADVARELSNRLKPGLFRAATVASTPSQLAGQLESIAKALADEPGVSFDITKGIFAGPASATPRIGFLFPGQASPPRLDGGLYGLHFEAVGTLYKNLSWPANVDVTATQVAQPGIATASLAALGLMHQLGIEASVAVGHSLGEIAALHWAGAFDEAALLRIATFRGRAMGELAGATGAMAAIGADAHSVEQRLVTEGVSIVGYNSPRQTVIAGEEVAVVAAVTRARSSGWSAVKLPVSHAFHTRFVAEAVPMLREALGREAIRPPARRIISTVTGRELGPEEDVTDLLCRQVTAPVRFAGALNVAATDVDLFIEVGPGEVLTGLARDTVSCPVVSLDACASSLNGFLKAAGAAFVLGVNIRMAPIFEGRFTRPFNLDWQPRFFTNPCELAPIVENAPRATAKSMDPLLQARNGHGQNLATPDRITLAPDSTPADSNEALSILEQVRESVAKRAELPITAIATESSLLGDLHLNSISVGQLVAEVAVQLHLPPIIGLTDFAGATVGKVAAILEDLCRRHEGGSAPEPIAIVPGVDSWVRPLLVEWVETPSPTESNGARHGLLSPGAGQGWEIITSPGHPLAASLGTGLATLAGLGVVVCLPPEANEVALDLLLRGARRAMEMGTAARFVLVQHGWGGAGFARSLFLESSGLTVSVIDLPFEHPLAVQWVVAEASRVGGFCEARYDTQGVRREPRLRAEKLSPDIPGEFPLGPSDVLLVTGGGKGIASECAFSLARRSGARLVLMGRSQPESDPELASNLERFAGAGIAMDYVSADVTDAAAVRSALAKAEKEWGPITAFLHGAGANVPKLIGSLDLAGFRHTFAPKIQGARNVLAVVGEQLRVFITFGSIIGRAGLAGEADYALANEWLTCLTTDYAAAHPGVRCLAAEWSVWSGLGMGARLGRIESLRQQGITPITPEQGTALLEQVLSCHQSPQVLVLAGRFGEMPTLRWAQPELPLARFLENPRVYYPGVELIAESTLSAGSDPYIEEHIYQGERLFPAVMGLEAMAQVAMALQGSLEPPSFEEVKFNRPVIVPRAGKLVIRVAALAKAPGEVDVVLRTGDTGFQVDHFRATCRFDVQPLSSTEPEDLPVFDLQACAEIRIPLAIDSDLYEDLLFHNGRFRRVKNYRVLRARECVVQLEPDTQSTWFGHYLPSKCVLGDAGVRDAAIHAIQACLPHARLLPAGVDRIVIGRLPCLDERLRAAGRKPVLLLHARERRRDGDSLYFDLELLAEEGTLLERWEGLCLRVIEKLERTKPWPLALLGPGVERRVEELVPGSRVAVIIGQDISSDDAIRQASGGCGAIRRRLDGKPGMEGTKGVSVAHAGSLTLAIAAPAPVGCDLEPVTGRTLAAWQVLLGPERIALAQQLAREMGEPFDHAATRTWTAIECLKKAGIPVESPLVLGPIHPDRWVMLRSGVVLIATVVAQVRDVPGELALAVLASERT